MRRGTFSLVAAAIAAVALLAPSGALADKANSRVTIDHYDDTGGDGIDWAGKVRSSRHQCEVGRTVLLYFAGPGAPNQVGDDKTDAKGRWQIHTLLTLDDEAFAKVKPRKLPNGLRCKGDRSAIFPLNG